VRSCPRPGETRWWRVVAGHQGGQRGFDSPSLCSMCPTSPDSVVVTRKTEKPGRGLGCSQHDSWRYPRHPLTHATRSPLRGRAVGRNPMTAVNSAAPIHCPRNSVARVLPCLGRSQGFESPRGRHTNSGRPAGRRIGVHIPKESLARHQGPQPHQCLGSSVGRAVGRKPARRRFDSVPWHHINGPVAQR
jgi:hypothetical protein